MTNKEAVNELKYIRRIYPSKNIENVEADVALDMAIKALEQELWWIPCSKRLPTRQENYICTCKNGSRVLKTTMIKWSNGWQLSGSRAYWKVIAWMPLPEPYKAESEE